MKSLSTSYKVYFGLVLTLACAAALNLFLPQGSMIPAQSFPGSKFLMALVAAGVILVGYGGLGLLGLFLAKKLGFPEIWDPEVTNRERFLIPGLIGAGLGVLLIVGDSILSRFNTFGQFPHPPFPTSIVASISAGIGEELIFRLFFISLWTFLISSVILRKRAQNIVFWIVTIFSAMAFAAGHLPSVMYLAGLKSMSDIPPVALGEIFLLNGVISIFAAYYFRKYGYLAAVGIHSWADVVWHVIWGVVG